MPTEQFNPLSGQFDFVSHDSGGTVTSVSGTSPVVSSGGITPAISIPAATSSVSGYLSSTDWSTFNGKEPVITATTSADYYGGDKAFHPLLSAPISTATQTQLTYIQGQHIVRCFQGGQYATLQACHDAASAGDTILLGPTSSSWGDVVITKKLSIIGVQGKSSKWVSVGSISINLTNSNANENEVHLENLYINSATASSIIVQANAFVSRVRVDNCFVTGSGLSTDTIVFNNVTSGSSLYINDSLLQANPSNTGTILHALGGYIFVRRSSFNYGVRGVWTEGGLTQFDDVTIEYANTGEAVKVTGGTFVSAFGLIRNLNAAGTGINMTSPAVVVLGTQTFDITSGTGYCIKGTGILFYDRVSFSNSAATPANVKFQNTVTIFPYTTAPSVVA